MNVITVDPPNRLRLFRQEAMLTQAALAERLGLGRGTIAKVEAGHERAWPKLRRDVARELGVSEAVLSGKRTA